jgi:hypothetical protein
MMSKTRKLIVMLLITFSIIIIQKNVKAVEVTGNTKRNYTRSFNIKRYNGNR